MTAAARTAVRSDMAARLLKAVQAERRAVFGKDDDTYRALLKRLTGVSSAADLDARQLSLVLDAMKGKTARPTIVQGGKAATSKRPTSRRADHPVAKKARALWISLHQLGAIENGSEPALEAFAKRQLGVDRLQWMNQAQSTKIIDALKAMAKRAGWDQSGSLDEIKARHAALMEARRA